MSGGARVMSLAAPLVAAAVLLAPVTRGPELPNPPPARPSAGISPAASPSATGLVREGSPAPAPLLASPAPPDGARLAGNDAGAGRTHPGRTTDPSAAAPSPPGARNADGTHDGNPADADAPGPPDTPGRPEPELPRDPLTGHYEPDPASTRDSGHRARATGYGDRVLRVLPLGTGLALTGLGLGFFALRLRRAR
ncbi:hypothetical protein [Streptomyces stramineus]